MRLLLDTNIYLWWLQNNPALASGARERISNPQNSVFVSAVSFWEIVIKKSLKKLRLENNLADELEKDLFEPLPITPQHVLQLEKLPMLHKDPFDRILVAQAQSEKLTLITTDEKIFKYEVSTFAGS